MKLMLPTNFDPELIAQIAPFKPDYIYGSLPSEATLRSSLMLSNASEDDVALHVSQGAQHGIRLVYVMNATCLGNKEFSDEGRGQLLQRLQWLVDIGAAAVVTANPFVMELVRENFPDLELHISVLASVNDLTDKLNGTLDANQDNIDQIILNLRDVSENLREFTDDIKTRPSSLILSGTPRARKPGDKQ